MAGTKITTTGVLYINGAQVENTFTNISKITKKLESELKKLPVGTKEFIEKSNELNKARAKFEEVRQEIGYTKKEFQELNSETSKSVTGTFGGLKSKLNDIFTTALSGQFSFKTLGTSIKAFAVESWAAISSIPLVGWLAAVAAGIGLVIKEAIDYNKQIGPLLKLLDNLGLDKKIIPQLNAIKEAFGVETEEIANMLDSLVDANVVKNQAAALEDIQIALSKAPDKAGLISFLDNSSETAEKLHLSLSQLINIKQDLENTPISPEKVFGAMDTFVNRVLSQSEKIRPILEKSFGADFSNKLYKGLVDGSISYSEALSKVYSEGEKLKISDKERADIAKAFFGKAGSSAYNYNQILNVISDSSRKLDQDLSESQKRTLAIAKANEELAIAQDKAYNSKAIRVFMGDFKLGWIYIQTKFYEIIALLREDFQPIFTTIGKVINYLITPFKQLFSYISKFSGDINIFKLSWENALIPIKTVFLVLGTVVDILGYLREKLISAASAIIEWASGFKIFKNIFDNIKSNISIAYGYFHKFYTLIINFPEAYHALESATKIFFKNLSEIFSKSADGLSHIFRGIFSFDSNEISKGLDIIKTNLKNTFTNFTKNFKDEFNKNVKAKNALSDIEKDSISNSPKNRETPNSPEKSKKEKSTKDTTKEDLQKSLDELRKSNADKLNEIQKFEDEKLKILEESFSKEIDLEDNRFTKEQITLSAEKQKTLQEITTLETEKANAKSLAAKANYQKAIEQKKLMLADGGIYDKIEAQYLQTHLFNLRKIREKWDAKKFEDDSNFTQRQIDNRRRDREQEITNISSLEQAKEKLRNQNYLKLTDDELSAIDNLEDAKAALREAYDMEMLKQQEMAISLQIAQLNEALNDKSLSDDARQKAAENLDFLKDKITQVRSAIKGGEDADNKKVTEENKQKKGSIDILGFSAQDWEDSFKNLDTTKDKVKAIGMVFTAMSNAASMFSELQKNIGERDLQRFEKQQSAKKKALLKNLNLGLINQEEYQKSIQKIEAETANKKAEIEYKQAKADKIARMFAIIGNTAAGIAAALPNIPLSIIVGALGAIQLGIVAAQPLPEKQSYATGGFTGSGFGSPDATGYKPAGIVHQNEWVAPEWMLQEPRTAKVIDYLESVRQGKTKPMAEGGFSENSTTPNNQNSTENNSDYVQYLAVLMQVKDLLQKLYDEGITAEMTDSEQNGKLFKKAIKKFETIETRASGK